jgi:hypothetical protein
MEVNFESRDLNKKVSSRTQLTCSKNKETVHLECIYRVHAFCFAVLCEEEIINTDDLT